MKDKEYISGIRIQFENTYIMSPGFTKPGRKGFVPSKERGGRESIVDMTGYVDPRQKLESFMRAGVNMAVHNMNLYDTTLLGEDFSLPPWRQRDFDVHKAADFLRTAVKRRDDLVKAGVIEIDASGRISLKRPPEALRAHQTQSGEQVQGVAPAAGQQGRVAPANDANAS